MAAGGGTFVAMNKILPGPYINFVSHPRAMATVGTRGIVAGVLNLPWGPQGEIVAIDAGEFQTNALNVLGFSFVDPEMLYVRELFLGARLLKFYRPKGGKAATAQIGNLSVTALYAGERGNDIQIIIEEDIDEAGFYFVTTMIYDGGGYAQVDEQKVQTLDRLIDNNFVKFAKATGVAETTLEETAGIILEGGTNAVITGNEHSQFLGLAEKEAFTTVFFDGADPVTKGLYAAFTRRLRDDEGYKITCVLHDYAKADHEGIISVMNKVDDENNPTALVYWVAGRHAGCEINQSLTNRRYNGTLPVLASYNSRELKAAVKGGQFVLYGDGGGFRVLRDTNTFQSINPNKNRDFQFNQVIRVLDEIGNSVARIFNDWYIGLVQNKPIGRTQLRADFIDYMEQLQTMEAIENFTADDITIGPGREKSDVLCDMFVQPVVAMEKLYNTVRVV
jgi:hypothetical protein